MHLRVLASACGVGHPGDASGGLGLAAPCRANIVKAATLNRVSRSSPLDQADVTRVLSTLASWRAPDT